MTTFTTADLPADLAACKVEELRRWAQGLGLPAVSKAKKADLVAALEEARAATPPARTGGGKRSFTDEQAQEVARLRHDELLSWRSIAEAVGSGSPGVARRAYRAATGCTGVLPRVPGKAGRPTAGMIAGTEQPEMLGAPEAD